MKKFLKIVSVITIISTFLLPISAFACNTNSNDYGTSGTNYSQHVGSDDGLLGGNNSLAIWVKIRTEPSNSTIKPIITAYTGNFDGYQILYKDVSGTKSMVFRREKQNVADDDSTYASGALGTTN